MGGKTDPARPSKSAPPSATPLAAPARRRRGESLHAALSLPRPPKDIPQRADATREKLLAAAHELLRERVGGPVSANEICERASINVAMVKYCFGSKDAMIGALVERIVGDFVRELESLDRLDVSATDKLRIHIAALVRNYARYPYVNRLLSTQFLEASAEVVTSLSNSFALPARDWYLRLLAYGRKTGEFRAVDPTLFFFTVIGLAEFFFTAKPLLRGFGIDEIDAALVDRYIAHVTEIVMHGVRAE